MSYRKLTAILFLALWAWVGLLWQAPTAVYAGDRIQPAPNDPVRLRFGAAVAHRDGERVLGLGFDWMLVYDPPHRREPVSVLYRLPVNRWSLPNDFYARYQFEQDLYKLAGEHADWIDAYEIGNEVNLYVNGWEGPPDAAAYVDLLCTVGRIIKIMDPTALIVSAGLAPTGRVAGRWQNRPGHNYLLQDEREYLNSFLDAGGGECVDAIGYHPLGFSANFDAEPDVNGGTPANNCENGFCFRGVEKIHEVLVENGYADKPIWATEVGWITEPTDPACLSDYSWSGRAWQRVSRPQQAENLVGAYQYAYANWPWLDAMFVFNLNFDQAPYYHACEQMRFYSIQGQETELALRGMMAELFDFTRLPIIKLRSR